MICSAPTTAEFSGEVVHIHVEPIPHPGGRTPHDVGEIFTRFGSRFRERHRLSIEQARAMRAIESCRTDALGGHRVACNNCEFAIQAYNSCRNRHCPKCMGSAQYRWIEARKERILNTPYFHIVFTLPEELRPIARRNPDLIFDLLFKSAAQTLLELGRDKKRLGGLLGLTAVLHTWSRTLAFHPHVHCIVTAGGLSPDEQRWRPARRSYLFPVRVMGALFRGKFLAGLTRSNEHECLDLGSDSTSFSQLVSVLRKVRWVVYAKQPFGGPAQVFQYLGQYTHRVGIANSRIRAVTDHGITFTTRGESTVTLDPIEFIRRFLMHVLPRGFVKIRHYGLCASVNARTKMAEAQTILGSTVDTQAGAAQDVPKERSDDGIDVDVREILIRVFMTDHVPCPRCQVGKLELQECATGPP